MNCLVGSEHALKLRQHCSVSLNGEIRYRWWAPRFESLNGKRRGSKLLIFRFWARQKNGRTRRPALDVLKR